MSVALGNTRKQCGVCEFWAGPREIIASRTQVKLDSTSDKGQCIGGKHNKVQMAAGTTCCPGFKKWALLK